MRISGKEIAYQLHLEIKEGIGKLSSYGIIPKIAIITLGPESSWESYVRQKIKVAYELGIVTVHVNLLSADDKILLDTIEQINSDEKCHGIIVQRPLPETIDKKKVIGSILPEKDVDGFRSDSPYEVPVFLAVKKLVASSLKQLNRAPDFSNYSFAVLGKGETAGRPTIQGLLKLGVTPSVVDSKTGNRIDIIKNSDIVISCVGRKNAVGEEELKKGVVLIGVGTHVEDGKIKGDYDEEKIGQVAASYTPTPGGVGPVNLSYLFKNLLKAASIQKGLDSV